MSFGKAVQRQDFTQEDWFQEYQMALIMYKRRCSAYDKLRRRLQLSNIPAERLQFFEAQAEFKAQCREYKTAREHYEAMMVRTRLKDKGIKLSDEATLSPKRISEILNLSIPVNAGDIIDEQRKQRALASLPPDFLEQLAAAKRKLAGEERKQFTYEERSIQRDLNDPTFGDFDPLPVKEPQKQEFDDNPETNDEL